MRVIAGKAKGRKLLSPPGIETRPITDRVKESLFNILAADVIDARFLDLFAGTGGVGIEALSRGARQAVFVEVGARQAQVIRDNLKLTGLTGQARIVRQDAFKYLQQPADEPFDIVYVAPPQYQGLWEKALQLLDGNAHVGEDGLVVVQIHPKEYHDVALDRLVLADRRRYGSTMLCFYEASGVGCQAPETGGRHPARNT